jgi:hypothetical protein
MIPQPLNLGPMRHKNTWMGLQGVQLLDETVTPAVPITLTGAQIVLNVYSQVGAPPVLSITTTMVPPYSPTAIAGIVVDTSGDFCTIGPVLLPDSILPGKYWWDLTMTLANGMVETPFEGSWLVV